MSRRGQVVAALETAVRSAMPDLPAGSAGWETTVRDGTSLTAGEVPHVFVGQIVESRDRRPYGSVLERYRVPLMVWLAGESEEAAEARRDAILDAIEGDPTLGGTVAYASVSEVALHDSSQTDARVLALVVDAFVRIRTAVDWGVEVELELAPGSAAGTVLAAIDAELAALTGGTRAASDYLEDPTPPAGGTIYQLAAESLGLTGELDGNVDREVLRVRVTVVHGLGVGETERDYNEGAKLAQQRALLDPLWWTAISGVYRVRERGSIAGARVGGE